MKKFLTKLVLIFFPLVVSILLTIIVFNLLADAIKNHTFGSPYSYMSNGVLYNLMFVYLPVLIALAVLVFTFILIRKLTIKFPRFVIVVALFILIGMNFLFKPFKIVGGDAGPYKNGQTVFSYLRELRIKRQLSLDEVVIFERNNNMEGVGVITALAGDKIENSYLITGEKFEVETVPSGFYALKFSEGRDSWLVSENKIKYVVWYPFK